MNVVFLGNAVKTLEVCSCVAARAYNWGRAAPTSLDSISGSSGILEKLRFQFAKTSFAFFFHVVNSCCQQLTQDSSPQ